MRNRMNNRVTLSQRKIKKMARQMFAGKWLLSIGVMAIFAVLTRAPGFLLSYFWDSDFAVFLLDAYSMFINGPLMLGLAYYFIETFRQTENAGLSSISNGFANMKSAFALYIRLWIRIMLWSMLFVIPGIIAAVRYSQAFFILADEPDTLPSLCIEKSKFYMFGNKANFCMLELSFLPLLIIAQIPSIQYALSSIDFSQILFYEDYIFAMETALSSPISVLLSAIPVLVLAYVLAANACFYDLLSGHLVLEYGDGMPLSYDPQSYDRYEITGFENRSDRNDR